MNSGRTIEVYDTNSGEWKEIPFDELKDGDRFRVFDNGERYINFNTLQDEWTVIGSPTPDPDGVLAVTVKVLREKKGR